MRYWLIALLINLSVPNGFAENEFDKVKNSFDDLPEAKLKNMASDIGSLCEHAASQLIMAKYDPKNFYVLRNLTYNKHKQDLGELDIIVFSNATNRAVFLYEVKCRIDEKDAYEKAMGQLQRFQTHIARCLRSPDKPGINVTDGHKNFSCNLFEKTQYRVLMPKDCSRKQSPAEHFNLSLAEIRQLQNYLKAKL